MNDTQLADQEEDGWLLMVADGLGGEVAGEVASASAIRGILNFANGLSSWIMWPAPRRWAEIVNRAKLYATAIQDDLRQQADADPKLDGMATTLTAVYVFDKRAIVASLGDSRAYLVRAGRLHQITRDHTLAQEMLDAGHASEEAKPFRNVISRCFSTQRRPVQFELFDAKFRTGDRLLVCTDGLTNMVDDVRLCEIISNSDSVTASCRELIESALAAGGRDNVTAILAAR